MKSRYYYAIIGLLLHLPVVCMEPKKPSISKIVRCFEACKSKNRIEYDLNYSMDGYPEVGVLPQSIAPVFITSCSYDTPLDELLINPLSDTEVVPNVQLWVDRRTNTLRLSEDIRRADETFKLKSKAADYLYFSCYDVSETKIFWLFDGLNDNDKAVAVGHYNLGKSLFGMTGPYEPTFGCGPQPLFYDVYVFTQSLERGKIETYCNFRPIIRKEKGKVHALLLEKNCNRILYNVENGDKYKLYIKDLLDHNDERYAMHKKVAELEINRLFVKIICLGKNTYFGITQAGDLYTIWLDQSNTIQLAEQRLYSRPKKFKDVSVDATVMTAGGFYPKIAFLTTNGEVFITHLDASERPTLFYARHIQYPTHIARDRIFYHNSKVSLVGGRQTHVYEFDDNFELAYCCSLLKKMRTSAVS